MNKYILEKFKLSNRSSRVFFTNQIMCTYIVDECGGILRPPRTNSGKQREQLSPPPEYNIHNILRITEG